MKLILVNKLCMDNYIHPTSKYNGEYTIQKDMTKMDNKANYKWMGIRSNLIWND